MASAMGLDWSDNRFEVVNYLNKFRLLVYTDYDKLKLFDDTFHCMCVESFYDLCPDPDCATQYQGFTLPEDVLGVVAAWEYGYPLKMRSRWRESHNGIGTSGLPRAEIIAMAQMFCTERDITTTSKLKVFCEHASDAGKVVTMEVIDSRYKQRKISFTLIHEGLAVSPFKVRKILSVSLPSGRCGSVKLMQDDGFVLSEYTPWETVPNYRRVKVATVCRASTILIQGTKKFNRIYFDSDIVEVGNQLIIEAAGRYFKFGENTVEADEINRAQLDKAEMNRLLIGEISRHRGHAIQDGSPFKGRPSPVRRTLPGYSR